jgi:hypothetical protein
MLDEITFIKNNNLKLTSEDYKKLNGACNHKKTWIDTFSNMDIEIYATSEKYDIGISAFKNCISKKKTKIENLQECEEQANGIHRSIWKLLYSKREN